MNTTEAKAEVRQLFGEGMTSPQAKEKLMEAGLSRDQANTIVLAVINDDMVLDDAQDTYKSTLMYGIITTVVGLAALLLTWGNDTSAFASQLEGVRWLGVGGLGMLYVGYQKWKLAKKA